MYRGRNGEEKKKYCKFVRLTINALNMFKKKRKENIF